MTRENGQKYPASPRHHAIAAPLHQEKAAPLHRRTTELELALTTDELLAAHGTVRELSAALEEVRAFTRCASTVASQSCGYAAPRLRA